jgi:hypothetical protein
MSAPERDRPWWLLPPTRVAPAWWLLMAAALLLVEYAVGSYNQFPVVYIIPVTLAAWYSGRWPALLIAIALPAVHLVFELTDTQSENIAALIARTAFRGRVITILALWFVRLSEHERALQQEVQTLKGLLPICSFCKSIKNDAGEWEHLERFISRRSETKFSHGLCPSCQEVHYGNLEKRKVTT